ncbi:MAG TPA: amidohydrolase [Candidatus Sulfotelmatobacter sp.]|nr:amidohydrolase [Candidatus Sulfotelmatobacter sp.]
MKGWHPLNWLAIPLLSLLGAGTRAHVQQPAHPAPADIVVTHGTIFTENTDQPWAEALAVSGEKILAVGSDSEIAAYRGAATKTIDARGRVVLPGFTDCHIHFLEGSLSLDWPDLNGAVTTSDLRRRLKEYAATHPGSGWVFGQGWAYEAFGEAALPDKKLLDEIFPERPVYLESFDAHTGWVNSKALALASIHRDTPDPLDGVIVRDPKTGEATGALVEDARHLVKNLVPMPSQEEKRAALVKGLALAGQYGLVRVHAAGEPPDTFGDFYDLDVFDGLRGEGKLSLRLYVSKVIQPPALTPADISALEEARKRYHDDWISVGAAKVFLDGVIEAHTAAMIEPYADDSRLSGSLMWSPEKFGSAVDELDRRGFQIFTHAVGDRAVQAALDAYDHAAQSNGTTDARHRIEHIETVSAQDVPRFAMLGVIASMQPLHAYPEEGVWGRNLGPKREHLAFAWNSLLKAGAHLAFGSDWEVVTLNPWPGVQTGVTREDNEGKPVGGWVPEQRISVAQAIAAYTIGAAYAGHREDTEGSLEPGKLADLIIVSQNPFEVDPHRLGKTEVKLTMVGGRVVYSQLDQPVSKSEGGAKSKQ